MHATYEQRRRPQPRIQGRQDGSFRCQLLCIWKFSTFAYTIVGKCDIHGRGSRLEQISFLESQCIFPSGGNKASIGEGLRWLC